MFSFLPPESELPLQRQQLCRVITVEVSEASRARGGLPQYTDVTRGGVLATHHLYSGLRPHHCHLPLHDVETVVLSSDLTQTINIMFDGASPSYLSHTLTKAAH